MTTEKSGQEPPRVAVERLRDVTSRPSGTRTTETSSRTDPPPVGCDAGISSRPTTTSGTLEDVITCSREDFDLDYDAYGWSLVYFLNNYLDADHRPVYRDAFLDYIDSYARKGARDPIERREEAIERAREYFVEKVKDPGASTWEAFEAALADVHPGAVRRGDRRTGDRRRAALSMRGAARTRGLRSRGRNGAGLPVASSRGPRGAAPPGVGSPRPGRRRPRDLLDAAPLGTVPDRG